MAASLSDDILDIYKDVKKGVLLYEQREFTEGIWEWKFSFETHWGNHTRDLGDSEVHLLHLLVLQNNGGSKRKTGVFYQSRILPLK